VLPRDLQLFWRKWSLNDKRGSIPERLAGALHTKSNWEYEPIVRTIRALKGCAKGAAITEHLDIFSY
jgi:hypothetical protein